jgi:RES domain-containing protein
VARVVHDPHTLEILAGLQTERLSTSVYRVLFTGRDPTIGSLAGGRWAPPQEIPVLYTSFDAEGALSEVYYHFSQQPVFPTAPVTIHTMFVTTKNTARLTERALLDGLGLGRATLHGTDYAHCQRIGYAAHFLGLDGLVVPSARHDSNNLVLFLDKLDSDPEVTESSPISWSEWKK